MSLSFAEGFLLRSVVTDSCGPRPAASEFRRGGEGANEEKLHKTLMSKDAGVIISNSK